MRITVLQIGGMDFPVQPVLVGAFLTLLWGILPPLQPLSIFGLGMILGSAVAMFWAFKQADQPYRYMEAFAIGTLTAFLGNAVLMLFKISAAVSAGGGQFSSGTMIGGVFYLLSIELAKCMLVGGGTAMIVASVERRRWRQK